MKIINCPQGIGEPRLIDVKSKHWSTLSLRGNMAQIANNFIQSEGREYTTMYSTSILVEYGSVQLKTCHSHCANQCPLPKTPSVGAQELEEDPALIDWKKVAWFDESHFLFKYVGRQGTWILRSRSSDDNRMHCGKTSNR